MYRYRNGKRKGPESRPNGGGAPHDVEVEPAL